MSDHMTRLAATLPMGGVLLAGGEFYAAVPGEGVRKLRCDTLYQEDGFTEKQVRVVAGGHSFYPTDCFLYERDALAAELDRAAVAAEGHRRSLAAQERQVERCNGRLRELDGQRKEAS